MKNLHYHIIISVQVKSEGDVHLWSRRYVGALWYSHLWVSALQRFRQANSKPLSLTPTVYCAWGEILPMAVHTEEYKTQLEGQEEENEIGISQLWCLACFLLTTCDHSCMYFGLLSNKKSLPELIWQLACCNVASDIYYKARSGGVVSLRGTDTPKDKRGCRW